MRRLYSLVNGSVAVVSTSTTPNTYHEAELLFSRVATSMTNNLRSETGNIMFSGVMTSNNTYVMVRWTYLALPVMVVVLTLLFLGAVMYAT